MILVGDDGGVLIEGDASFGPGNAAIAALGLGVDDLPGLHPPLAAALFDHVSDIGPAVELPDRTGRGIDHGLLLAVAGGGRPVGTVRRAAHEEPGEQCQNSG